MIVRVMCIILFLVGPIIIMIRDNFCYGFEFNYDYGNGVQHYFKLIDFTHFNSLFSNLTFAFTCQHSIPSMVINCYP